MIKFNNTKNKSYLVNNELKWDSRSVAVVGIIVANYNNENYVLVAKRGKHSADYQGLWNVPCGYLDWDENGYDAVCREVYEETGFYIPEYKNNYVISYLDQPFYVNTNIKENKQNVSLSYGIYFNIDKLPELSNKNSEFEEVEELLWLNLSDINKYKFAFDHDTRISMFKLIIKHTHGV